MTRSTVTETTYINLDYCNLEDCISNLTDAFNRVPEDCRSTARFNLEYGVDYGSPYARTEISYQRPETDKEMNDRVQRNKDWEDQRIIAAKKLLGIK